MPPIYDWWFLTGIKSHGMVLAADVDGKPILLYPEKEVPPGSKIR